MSNISRTLRLLSSHNKNNNKNDPVRWGILSAGRIASDYTKAISVTEGAVVSFSLPISAIPAAFF